MVTKKRLIDANALIEHLTMCKEQGKGLFSSVCVAIKCFVEQMPTVDAVEVVHGRWEESEDGDGVVCSVCGTDFCILFNETDNFNYCPNCGAKMDGDEGD